MVDLPPNIPRRVAQLLTPFVLASLYVLLLFLILDPRAFQLILGAMLTYLLSPLGVEIVIPTTILVLGGDAFQASVAILSIVLVDVFIALFFFWNFDLAEKIPLMGRFIRRTERICFEKMSKRRWGEKVALTSLALYVALPFQMSGGLVGSVLGRVLGIERFKVFLSVSLGSLAGGLSVGIATYFVGPPLVTLLASNLIEITGILIVVAFIAVLLYIYFRYGRVHEAEGA